MDQNPLLYGVSWEEFDMDPSLGWKRRDLVTDAARGLDRAKMMRFDEKTGNFYPMELGRIASHFYIQYTSVEIYNKLLRRKMTDTEILEMVARSTEFENIAIRDDEEEELMELEVAAPFEVKGGPSVRHGKVAILIQLYISGGLPAASSLVSDSAYINASLARIFRALYEICLHRNWAEMSWTMLEYCKAVELRVWPHQHPLTQFSRDVPDWVMSKLEDLHMDLDELMEKPEKDIPGGKQVKQLMAYFPYVLLSASVSPITRSVLKVDLAIKPDFTWNVRYHGDALRWLILVEDSENDHIYYSETFTVTRNMAKEEEPQKISFTVPLFDHHPDQYHIRAISDTWLHSDYTYTLPLTDLALSESNTSHTELLDTKPLPLTALGNKTYEDLYRFTHFNPIQTQAFHVLYHTSKNVLLGAPTGSGKTIYAELAMLHLFNTRPGMKVVYIAPLKAIVREIMNDWKKNLAPRLGKKIVEMTGDHTPDLKALLSADIIISTPEKWDSFSHNWQNRSYVTKVGLVILDEIHLLGAVLEVIVSRMRYISFKTDRGVRFVGLSTALANTGDLADWLGVEEIGLFNFKPSVRPGKFCQNRGFAPYFQK